MESPTNPFVQIIYHTKEGSEYSLKIEFETNEEYKRWSFERFFLDRIQHERGMFPTNQAELISVDIIARIEYESYGGIPF